MKIEEKTGIEKTGDGINLLPGFRTLFSYRHGKNSGLSLILQEFAVVNLGLNRSAAVDDFIDFIVAHMI